VPVSPALPAGDVGLSAAERIWSPSASTRPWGARVRREDQGVVAADARVAPAGVELLGRPEAWWPRMAGGPWAINSTARSVGDDSTSAHRVAPDTG